MRRGREIKGGERRRTMFGLSNYFLLRKVRWLIAVFSVVYISLEWLV